MSIFPAETESAAIELLQSCRVRGLMIATAESCTGGLLAASLTAVAGSSDVFERGVVSYSNQSKIDLLGVAASTLEQSGAVSRETAVAMAEGLIARSEAGIGISITGVAGPGGGSDDKPVGLVHMASFVRSKGVRHSEFRFQCGSRTDVQLAAVSAALRLLSERVIEI